MYFDFKVDFDELHARLKEMYRTMAFTVKNHATDFKSRFDMIVQQNQTLMFQQMNMKDEVRTLKDSLKNQNEKFDLILNLLQNKLLYSPKQRLMHSPIMNVNQYNTSDSAVMPPTLTLDEKIDLQAVHAWSGHDKVNTNTGLSDTCSESSAVAKVPCVHVDELKKPSIVQIQTHEETFDATSSASITGGLESLFQPERKKRRKRAISTSSALAMDPIIVEDEPASTTPAKSERLTSSGRIAHRVSRYGF